MPFISQHMENQNEPSHAWKKRMGCEVDGRKHEQTPYACLGEECGVWFLFCFLTRHQKQGQLKLS